MQTTRRWFTFLILIVAAGAPHLAAQWAVVSGSLAYDGNAGFQYAGRFPDVSYTYWGAPPTYVAYVFKNPDGSEKGWSGPLGGTPGAAVPIGANGTWNQYGTYTVEFWYLQNPSYGVFERKTLVSTYQFTVSRPTYTVSTSVAGTGTGNVSGGGKYNLGAAASVVASPGSGSTLTEWSVTNESGTAKYPGSTNPLLVTIVSDTTIVANFERSDIPVVFSLQSTSRTYTGAPLAVSVTPSVISATYTVLYSKGSNTYGPYLCNGLAAPAGPINVGSYAVSIVTTGTYSNVTPNPVGTFTITPKPVTFSFGNTTNVYTGGSFTASVAATDPAATFGRILTYGPGVGTYTVSATANGNYSGTGQAGARITPTPVSFSFGNTDQTYTGGVLSATVTANPADATYTANLDGGPDTGDYPISATGTGNFAGSGAGTLTITKATPVVSWAAPAPITYGTALSPAQLNATVNVAGTFSYSPAAGAILDAGPRTLTVTFTPSDTRNYNNASRSVALTVQRKPVTFAFGGLGATYNGAAQAATVSPSDPSATFTADLSRGPNAGTYAVSASATGNYVGTGTATLVIAPIPQTVTLTPASPTVVPDEAVTFHAAGGHTGYQWGGNTGAVPSGDTATATVSTPGTYTITVSAPGSTNYLPSNTATATLQVSADRRIVRFTPLESSYTVSDPASPMIGQAYPRIWNSGGWVAYLGRAGVRFAVTAQASPSIQAIELQSRPPGGAWAPLASESPAAGQTRADVTFSVMLGGTAPGQPFVPLSYYNGNPQTGTWTFRARVQDAVGVWSDFSPEVPVNVVLPITSRTLSGQTVPPAGALGDWFTASPVQSYSFQFWVP